MQTKFAMGGSSVNVFKMNESTILDKLPPQVYSVSFHPMLGFSLNILKSRLEIPSKIYGKTALKTEKCLKSYRKRPQSTGILLTGDKGTGKTLQMAHLANAVIDRLELPVIMVTEPHSGADFTTFIESLGEICLIFDEFGKMYKAGAHARDMDQEAPQQNTLLSLMDGVDKTKRMIILTENSLYNINDYMINRPSRIYYHFQYKKLPEDSITEYCIDKEVGDAITNEILEISRRSKLFSFDMLQSIVEEYLRFESPIKEIVADLNIDISEDTIMIKQVLKIIDKETNTEVPVYKSPVITQNPGEMLIVSVTDDSEHNEEGFIDIYLESHQIVYTKEDQVVYDSGGYIISIKTLSQETQNYSMIL